jgi:Mrp family chromosome partitioning ATPase
MSRMLEALKALQDRKEGRAETEIPPQLPLQAAAGLTTLADAPPSPNLLQDVPSEPARLAPPQPALEPCVLPTTPELSQRYHQLAERISEQVAANYCSVLLFVAPNRAADACFSITRLAEAFALQSAGNVLLVDGDLRRGQLSQAVCPSRPGLIEAMSATVRWPEVIHPTNVERMDFVPRGKSPIPTFERSEFGWDALRSQYRVVLIGLAEADCPETTWLAARCDGVYFVVSRPHTRRRSAGTTITALRACGASVLGCIVVND